MRLSRDVLMADAGASGFRAEILEKCELLLGLLQGLADDPFLGPRLALKGGTATSALAHTAHRRPAQHSGALNACLDHPRAPCLRP